MKVAVTATAPSLDAQVDPRFGRCTCFLVIDTVTLDFEAVPNMNAGRNGGAGIQAAQVVAGCGVRAVLTGNCGPNAHRTLAAAGINIVTGCSGQVREMLAHQDFEHLQAGADPNVQTHFGMGAGTRAGFGRGGAGGRGAGRQAPAPAEQVLAELRRRAEMMRQETELLRQQILALSGGQTQKALCDTSACLGCGTCMAACPVGAIGLQDGAARVDQKLCIGCGQCVSACPNQAMSLG